MRGVEVTAIEEYHNHSGDLKLDQMAIDISNNPDVWGISLTSVAAVKTLIIPEERNAASAASDMTSKQGGTVDVSPPFMWAT